MARRGTRLAVGGIGALMLAALGGCADSLPSLPKIGDLNPWKEKQIPLPGKRVPVMQTGEGIPGELADASKPIALPPQRANDSWSQPGGEPGNAPGHLALSGTPRQAWTADAGEGSSKSGRVVAPPVVYEGRVYTLDAAGQVSAFSVSGGSAVWRISLKPDREKKAGGMFSLGGSSSGGGYGGGLAIDAGRLYAASGYGNVVALDPASGKKLWEKSVGTPVRAAPTAAGDRVYVINLEGRFFCLAGADGTELWTVRGLPQQASLLMTVSPAVDGDVVVVPYASGDLVALRTSEGSGLWSENLARTRAGSQLNSLSDAARPAIDAGTVYAVGHAGRMIATQVRTGERLWSLNVASTQTPWPAGGSVFVVDTGGQLLAIDRHEGKVQWTVKLPDASNWSGPVLAGGTLWLTSSNGLLAGVDPATGRVTTQTSLGGSIFIPPVVAAGRMFVLTDGAKLIALN